MSAIHDLLSESRIRLLDDVFQLLANSENNLPELSSRTKNQCRTILASAARRLHRERWSSPVAAHLADLLWSSRSPSDPASVAAVHGQGPQPIPPFLEAARCRPYSCRFLHQNPDIHRMRCRHIVQQRQPGPPAQRRDALGALIPSSSAAPRITEQSANCRYSRCNNSHDTQAPEADSIVRLHLRWHEIANAQPEARVVSTRRMFFDHDRIV
jgi:hypothetical protein